MRPALAGCTGPCRFQPEDRPDGLVTLEVVCTQAGDRDHGSCSDSRWGRRGAASHPSGCATCLPAAGLSFVATADRRVIGTVRLWNVRLTAAPTLLLGPLAVDRDFQSAGIGSTLMGGLTAPRPLGHEAVILVGEPRLLSPLRLLARLPTRLWMPEKTDRRRFLGVELTRNGLAGARGLKSGPPAGQRYRAWPCSRRPRNFRL